MFHITPIAKPWQICKVKKCAQSWQIIERNLSIRSQKHPSLNGQTSTTHTGFFWGQASMHNYSSYTLLHTPQSLKALDLFFKAFWNYPLHWSEKSAHPTTEAKIPNSKKFRQTFGNRYIGERQTDIDCPLSRCSPTGPRTAKDCSPLGIYVWCDKHA
jgi:hypothetical protein